MRLRLYAMLAPLREASHSPLLAAALYLLLLLVPPAATLDHQRGGKIQDRLLAAALDLGSDLVTKLDLSCLMGRRSGGGFLKAPDIPNAILKYSRGKNHELPHNRFLMAVYKCMTGFTLRHPLEDRLYCSQETWLGEQPVCVEEVEDIDECEQDNGGCDDLCVNTAGSFNCGCRNGLRLATDGHTCLDVNECLLRNGHGPCQDRCVNKWGTYECSCEGIAGTKLAADNHTCQDVDECADGTAGCSHKCVNTVGSAFCECPAGFMLGDDWRTCQDVDECALSPHSCSHECVNDVGGFHCSCHSGFALAKDNITCEDVDECSQRNISSCSHHCINEVGSYHCECPSGYSLGSDQQTCEDVDECSLSDGGCSHKCVNTPGGYYCTCPPNAQLASTDNRRCVLKDPCLTDNGGCDHHCTSEGTKVLCTCKPGYRLKHDKMTCDDEDECESGVICHQLCTNTPGSFECSCKSGFQKFGNQCIDLNECETNNGGCSHICNNTLGSFQCSCETGFSRYSHNESLCVDVNECKDNNGGCNMDCVNTAGSYYCACSDDYILANDQRTCIERVPIEVNQPDAEFGHSFCSPPNEPENGEIHCPGFSNDVTNYYPTGVICHAHCQSGFKLVGAATRHCDDVGRWTGIEPSCIAVSETPRPFIHCPRDLKLDLPHHQSSVHVRIPQPKSNMDWWRYVDSEPSWGKQLEADLTIGTTRVKFTARNPIDNSSASCTVSIFVKDVEPPRMINCPQSFDINLHLHEKSRIIHWKEPTFIDNVGIVRIYKSKEPGKPMSAGLHHVNYLASDAAGNRAKCQFSINVKEHIPARASFPAGGPYKILCSSANNPRKMIHVYPWQIPNGCNPSHGSLPTATKTQVMMGTFTVRHGARHLTTVRGKEYRMRHRNIGDRRKLRKQPTYPDDSSDHTSNVDKHMSKSRRKCC